MSNLPNRRFFVVIHTLRDGSDHVLKQTKLAQDNGADGVFIIPDYAKGTDKMATLSDQFNYLKLLKENLPNFLIGVNFLKKPADIVPDIYSNPPDLFQTDGNTLSGLDISQMQGTEFFAGLAFKYSKNVHLTGDALKEHCEYISSICQVPTTSGDATGIPASLDKIREIRSYLSSDKRLGLASGVDENNVLGYLDAGVTDFLVATSLISHVDTCEFDILDPEKISKMASIIRCH